MSTVNELRTQRAKSWEKANAFLIAHRDGKAFSQRLIPPPMKPWNRRS